MKTVTNAFELCNDKHMAKLMLMKSELMISIRDKISEDKLTQDSAAKIMKVTQPRVSDLCRGKISKFSFDLLFVMNERLKST